LPEADITHQTTFLKKLYGNTIGLKPNQIKRLGNLYRRRFPPEFLLSHELARDLCRLSREIHRQIGIMVNRRSKVAFVIVGDSKRIVIPPTGEYRAAPGRLTGLRCIHTHLNHEALTTDDLTDLALLRLDLMAVINSRLLSITITIGSRTHHQMVDGSYFYRMKKRSKGTRRTKTLCFV